MRYSGSKRRFMKELTPILMEHLTDDNTLFVDVFLGGGNVISEIPHPNKWGVELNRYVLALWKHVKECAMDGIPESLTETEYYTIKEDYINKGGKYPDWLIGYVGSCCSYGGGWFSGYAKFNPNKNEDHIKEAYNGLNKQLKNFKYMEYTEFICCSYDELSFPPNSVIYCDPPYADTKRYESDFNHERFWEWVRKMSRNGHYVYVSEYIAPFDFKCIWSKEKCDGMGTTRKGKKQSVKVEKLFVYDNIK